MRRHSTVGPALFSGPGPASVFPALVLAAVMLAGCGSPTGPAAPSGTATVPGATSDAPTTNPGSGPETAPAEPTSPETTSPGNSPGEASGTAPGTTTTATSPAAVPPS